MSSELLFGGCERKSRFLDSAGSSAFADAPAALEMTNEKMKSGKLNVTYCAKFNKPAARAMTLPLHLTNPMLLR
jgi:hypothetical protein